MKSRFQLIDDHYVWNYWEPFSAGDIDVPANKTRHWIGVHPNRPYQASEVHQIVEAYHTGVVFDRTDIERIVNTNLKVMWNGDRETPKFRNSNGAPIEKQTAGELWTGLQEFDQTVRDLHEGQLSKGRGGVEGDIGRAYFENVVKKTPPGFARKYASDLKTKGNFLLHHCPDIFFAAALESGKLLLATVATPGELEIAVYSADGKEKLKTLEKRRRGAIAIFRWDNPQPCRIRWTFNGGSYREFPVA
jgi:hypothetical protein